MKFTATKLAHISEGKSRQMMAFPTRIAYLYQTAATDYLQNLTLSPEFNGKKEAIRQRIASFYLNKIQLFHFKVTHAEYAL